MKQVSEAESWRWTDPDPASDSEWVDSAGGSPHATIASRTNNNREVWVAEKAHHERSFFNVFHPISGPTAGALAVNENDSRNSGSPTLHCVRIR